MERKLLSKRKFLVAAVGLALTCLTSYGQKTYTFSHTTKTDTVAPCNTLSEFELDINNESINTAVTLNWKLISKKLPKCWDCSFCDWQYCNYNDNIPTSTQTPPSISAGTKGYFRMGVNIADTGGTSNVKVYVYEPSKPNDGDTVTFIVKGCTSSVNPCQSYSVGLAEKQVPKKAVITISPNPTTDFLNIKITNPLSGNNTESIEIFNIIGKKVMTVSLSKGENNKISLNNLSAGIYFIKHINRDGAVSTLKFYKTSN